MLQYTILYTESYLILFYNSILMLQYSLRLAARSVGGWRDSQQILSDEA